MLGGVEVAGLEADAAGFVGDFALLRKVFHRAVVVEDLLLELGGFLAIAFEGVGHGHHSLRDGFQFGRVGGVDGLGEIFAGFVAMKLEVEDDACSDVGWDGIRRGFERGAVESQRVVEASLAHELLALVNVVGLLLGGRRLRRERRGESEKRQTCRGDSREGRFHARHYLTERKNERPARLPASPTKGKREKQAQQAAPLRTANGPRYFRFSTRFRVERMRR